MALSVSTDVLVNYVQCMALLIRARALDASPWVGNAALITNAIDLFYVSTLRTRLQAALFCV